MTVIRSGGSLANLVDRLCRAYKADRHYLGIMRIAFALYLLVRPTDYTWVGEVPGAFFQPAPGPFSLLSGPPPAEFFTVLEVTRVVLAIALLVGLRTVEVSIALTVVMVVGAGLTNSFGKVDHFILFEILPLAMAAAGWGAAFSVDAYLRRGRHRPKSVDRGLPMLIWAMVVAFALFTAAVPKAISGWLNPSREGTRGFVARDVADDTDVGVLTHTIFDIDSVIFWKFLDYATIVAEASLVVLIFFPVLFRLGIFVMLAFHLGVYLTLGIEFDSYLFVYLPFFAGPVMWLIRRYSSRSPRRAPGEAVKTVSNTNMGSSRT